MACDNTSGNCNALSCNYLYSRQGSSTCALASSNAPTAGDSTGIINDGKTDYSAANTVASCEGFSRYNTGSNVKCSDSTV